MHQQNKEFVSQLFTPVAIIVGSIIIAWAIASGPSAGSINPTAAVALGNTNNNPAPTVAVDSAKVSTAGNPVVGNPNAKLTIAYWFDYQCPFCKKSEQTIISVLMKDYVDTGKVRIVFKDLQFLGTDSTKLGTIGRAVWEATPDKYYAWHKAMFENQGQENSGWATDAYVLSISTSVLGASDAARVMDLAKQKSESYKKLLDADKAEGAAIGVRSTPNMVIGKTLVTGAQPYEQVKTAVDKALNSK
ncbi:MAG: thioredoxin domain-containing protein [Candidatus Paceibacterota bacterium]